jgi:hypothetical protein
MSKKKTSNKGGRPSKFDTVDLKQVEILTKAGWTDVQMAEFFGVCKKTWDNWKAKHAEFLHTLKDWKAIADHEVERSLYQRACGYETTEERIVGTGDDARVLESTKQWPPDTTAIIFWLKNRNRAEWRDKQDHEHTGSGGGPIKTINMEMTPQDAADAYADTLNDE